MKIEINVPIINTTDDVTIVININNLTGSDQIDQTVVIESPSVSSDELNFDNLNKIL